MGNEVIMGSRYTLYTVENRRTMLEISGKLREGEIHGMRDRKENVFKRR